MADSGGIDQKFKDSIVTDLNLVQLTNFLTDTILKIYARKNS